jgi:hypothetical protein
MYQISVTYFKWTKNTSTFFNLRPSKIFPNWDFLFLKLTIWQPWVSTPGNVSSAAGQTKDEMRAAKN